MVPDKGSQIHINVSQNDDKCRTFIFRLYSSDGSWTAPASATATIEGRKDDGKFFSFACTYSNGEVTVIVQQQMVAVAGKVRCKIKLVSGAETIESAPFYFVVNPKSMPVNADMSKSDVVDAVAKATQKIVDQVAENIPEDYVKLNEDVSGLKSDIVNGGLAPVVYTYDTFKSNGEEMLIYREDGTTAATVSNLTIQFIPVVPKCIISYTLTQMANVATIALYDQNMAFVKAIYSENDSDWINPTPLSGTYVVDDGIYYMSLCVENNMSAHYTENLKLELSGTISKILPNKIETLEKDWIYKFEELFTNKWAGVDLGNLNVGDKIYLNIFEKSENVEIESLKVQGYKTLNNSPVALNTLTFGVGKFIELDTNYEKVEVLVTLKEFVKNSWVHGYFVKIGSETQLSEIYKNISKIKDQLSDVVDNTTILKTLSPQVANEIVRLTYEDVDKSEKVGYLTTDGVFVNTGQYRLSPIIPVAEGDEIEYQCAAYYSHVPVIIFYDKNHNYIKHLSGDGRTWDVPYSLVGKENIPHGCYYIRWCMEHANDDHYRNQYVSISRK